MRTRQPNGRRIKQFAAHHRAARERLYAVVDAARDRELAFAARDRFGLEMHSLFEAGPVVEPRGDTMASVVAADFRQQARERMSKVAPYLIDIEGTSSAGRAKGDYLEQWAAKLGTSAGILCLSDIDAVRLAIHLRRIFRVSDEDHHRYYFRFYDPRVLRPFLPTCNPREAEQFFGPIKCILVEAEDRGGMIVSRPTATGVKCERHPIDGDASHLRGRN